MKWVFLGVGVEGLIDADGKILARVQRLGSFGPWVFQHDEYIDEQSAKAAAEKHIKRPRTCSTCAHKTGLTFEYSRCALSGFFVETERKYGTVCGREFDGWKPRESVLSRLKAWIWGQAT